MKRKLIALVATAMFAAAVCSPAYAANAAPGNSDFTGGGSGQATTNNCAPAATPGCGR